uniref:Mastermind like transcriptional coactivator 3 n=1 Tax=Pelusios castaneus TaxID=367368 RepID=A0A8C8RCG7_9SAUR
MIFRGQCSALSERCQPHCTQTWKHLKTLSSPFIFSDKAPSNGKLNSSLQETVKRKLEGARSPLNGEQQNGVCDGSFSPTSKRIRKDVPGIDAINSLPNNLPLPSVSPLHQLDMKPSLPLQKSGTHASGLEDLGKNGGLPEIKIPVNGCSELEDSFNILQNKELKQEPLDDPTCIDTSETSLSNQNKLFSDINLNDQEWQELIDELANTVPEDDIQDLFNEDFEEKKEPEFPRPAAEPQESASVKSDPSHSPFAHVPMGSPQVRPISSSPQTPNQPHTPGQAQSRPGNGYLINPAAVTVTGSGPGPVAIPNADLSPAEQLKQMAAQQQQRAKLMHQKQQQQHPNQTSSWSPVGPPSSPYGGPFSADKPNSPMMYPQAFNNQNPIVPPMANNPQKNTLNNYLPQNHLNMINQQTNNLGTNSLSKQPNVLTYGNTKPLTHFNAELSQRMTPPMVNPSKNPMMPYIQQQQSQQPQIQAQMTHLSEEQKRMLIMKQKGMMNQQMAYAPLPSLGQVSMNTGRTLNKARILFVDNQGKSSPNFLGNQPQAAIMKQMLIDQRAQLHVMEQQKQQFLREQRQQQQQILAEQVQLFLLYFSPYGSPQDIAAVRNQAALQSMRTSRMMAQNANMMAMGPSQNPGTAGQSEMGMTPYSNTSTSQAGMYSMSTGMSQMLQHPNQSGINIAHSAGQGSRPPASGQGVGIVSSFGQSILVNSIPQQHQQMKGPVGQVLPRPQAPRLQNMMGTVPQGAQNWQQQRGLQGISGRTGSEIGSYNNGTTYPVQSGQPRLPKQHFPQGINHSVVDTSGTVRALNPAMGRQMLQQLPAQQGASQARGTVMPAISQGVPTMPGFNQPPTQQMPGGNFAQSSQGQVYERNPTQDMSYNYSNEGAGGSFSSIAEGAELVDSIIKGGPGDEWMQELDELFGNP